MAWCNAFSIGKSCKRFFFAPFFFTFLALVSFTYTSCTHTNYDDNKLKSFSQRLDCLKNEKRSRKKNDAMQIWCWKQNEDNQSFLISCATQADKGLLCAGKNCVLCNQQLIIECVHIWEDKKNACGKFVQRRAHTRTHRLSLSSHMFAKNDKPYKYRFNLLLFIVFALHAPRVFLQFYRRFSCVSLASASEEFWD